MIFITAWAESPAAVSTFTHDGSKFVHMVHHCDVVFMCWGIVSFCSSNFILRETIVQQSRDVLCFKRLTQWGETLFCKAGRRYFAACVSLRKVTGAVVCTMVDLARTPPCQPQAWYTRCQPGLRPRACTILIQLHCSSPSTLRTYKWSRQKLIIQRQVYSFGPPPSAASSTVPPRFGSLLAILLGVRHAARSSSTFTVTKAASSRGLFNRHLCNQFHIDLSRTLPQCTPCASLSVDLACNTRLPRPKSPTAGTSTWTST